MGKRQRRRRRWCLDQSTLIIAPNATSSSAYDENRLMIIMDPVTYNITSDRVAEYIDRRIIVRSFDPDEFVRVFPEEIPEGLQYVQLLSASVQTDALATLSNWGRNVPLDVVMGEPATDFPLLYNFSKLLDRRPVRVSIPVVPGFLKAVTLALALHFAVKLVVGQPDAALIDEIGETLDIYLHRPNVSQPVEFFHSLFLSAYRDEPVNIWSVQEDDPEHFCYVADDGTETLSPRFGGAVPDGVSRVDLIKGDSASAPVASECDTCDFFSACRGYFKWPDSGYNCDGVKSIFATIDTEAAELRENVASINTAQTGAK